MKQVKMYYFLYPGIIFFIIMMIFSCYFQEVTFELTIETNGYGETTPSGTVEVMNGTLRSITAQAHENYHFTHWEVVSGNGVSLGDENAPATTVTLTESDAVIRANFASDQYTLTVLHQGNGTTNPAGEIIVTHGEAISISATPDEDWIFAGWEVVYGTGCEIADPGSMDTTIVLAGGNAVVRGNFADELAPEGYSVEIEQEDILADNETSLSFSFYNAEVYTTYYYSIDDTKITTDPVTGSGTVEYSNSQITGIDVSSLDDGLLTLSFSLIDLSGNQGVIVCDTVMKESIIPNGSFNINNNDSCTISNVVTLYMNINDADEMRFGNSRTEVSTAPWVNYAESEIWFLSDEIEIKTVYGEFRDSAGHTYSNIDSIRKIKKIKPSDASSNATFGNSVDISYDGKTIVVGAVGDNNTGAFYVYEGAEWDVEMKATGIVGEDSCFGTDVAISADGDTIVAGSPCTLSGTGSVYVFQNNYGVLTNLSILNANGEEYIYDFGKYVSISADSSTIIVKDNCDGNPHVYYGSNWETKRIINFYCLGGRAKPLATTDNGSIIVASSPGHPNVGGVHVFHGIDWNTRKTLIPSDNVDSHGSQFGMRVATSLYGNEIVTIRPEAVYVYTDYNWETEIKLAPINSYLSEGFGSGIDISSDGNVILVSSSSGVLGIYGGDRPWDIRIVIIPDDGMWDSSIIALSGNGKIAVVGTPDDDENYPNSGAVYIIPLEDTVYTEYRPDRLSR